VDRKELHVLDIGAMLDRVGGDTDLLRELARIFREDCPKLLAEIRRAVATENAPALMQAAHTLKGAVANFGADAAREAAFRLEIMGRAGDLKPAREAVGDLESEIQRFEQALSALAQRLSTAWR
jgi:two-component system sensor histidine kinase/response regulator